MTTPHPLTTLLSQMPALAELFRLFLSGKHLNRIAEPVLWAELEQQQASYAELFAALGFELRLDGRGFAWFHSGDASSTIGKTSRQLALLFMLIFDAQANTGKTLQRFNDWLLDNAWLTELYNQQQQVLAAEGLSVDGLIELLGRACSLGFAQAEPAGWRLLPAVCRYLDHFEDLALSANAENAANESADSPSDQPPDDKEIN